MNYIEFISLFASISGFIIGIGAVTVIDLHGFLGRKSGYWTEATTRTHKVTKPLIWLGTFSSLIGGISFYWINNNLNFMVCHLMITLLLMANGLFLSFKVSPFLLEREKKGKSSQLLPDNWQKAITISFIISFIGNWSLVLLLVYYLTFNS